MNDADLKSGRCQKNSGRGEVPSAKVEMSPLHPANPFFLWVLNRLVNCHFFLMYYYRNFALMICR